MQDDVKLDEEGERVRREIRARLGLCEGVKCPAIEEAAQAVEEHLVPVAIVWGLCDLARSLTSAGARVSAAFCGVWSVHVQGMALGALRALRIETPSTKEADTYAMCEVVERQAQKQKATWWAEKIEGIQAATLRAGRKRSGGEAA